MSNIIRIGSTVKSTIRAPAPVAKRISHIFDPNISPTAIPWDSRRKAVKSATNSGKLVPNPTIKRPTTLNGIFNSIAKLCDASITISALPNKIRNPTIKKLISFFNVDGFNKLIWHGKPIRYKDMQLLPRFLRKYPGNYPIIIKYWMRIKDNIKRFLKINKWKLWILIYLTNYYINYCLWFFFNWHPLMNKYKINLKTYDRDFNSI